MHLLGTILMTCCAFAFDITWLPLLLSPQTSKFNISLRTPRNDLIKQVNLGRKTFKTVCRIEPMD